MRLVAAVVATLVLVASPARGDDATRAIEPVTCPGPRALEIALYVEGITDVRATLEAVDEETLRLRATRDEQTIVDRTIARARDCDALAEAIALIVSARISVMDTDADTEPAAAERDVETPISPPDTVEASRPGSAVGAVRTSKSAPPPSNYLVSAGLIGLMVAPVDAVGGTLSAELDVGITSRRGRGVRLSLGREAAAPISEEMERIAWTVRGEVVTTWRKRASWLRLGAGGALVVSRVTSYAPMVTTVRSHPALTTSATLGVRVGHGVSVRVDSSWAYFPVVDRYRMAGEEVARSPRASFGLGVGAQIDTDW